MLRQDGSSSTGAGGVLTCSRGLSSRKKNLPSSSVYRYSTVAAPRKPTALARERAQRSISRSTSGPACAHIGMMTCGYIL